MHAAFLQGKLCRHDAHKERPCRQRDGLMHACRAKVCCAWHGMCARDCCSTSPHQGLLGRGCGGAWRLLRPLQRHSRRGWVAQLQQRLVHAGQLHSLGTCTEAPD
jgi:hypothetical protein